MRFYVSWYPGDPDYPLYDDDCAMLVSITSVARNWNITRWPKLPRRLIIDSGGYRYAMFPQEAIPPTELYQRQLKLLNNAPVDTLICARDYPILDSTMSINKKDTCITQTIAYAYELNALISQYPLPQQCKTLAIIQGYDTDSLVYCAKALQAIGFDYYGIGSLAVLRHHTKIMKRVEAVVSVLGVEKLHIFGVTAIKTAQTLHAMGINSLDSSRPAKAAMYNEILYSNPYRRYGILEPAPIPMAGKTPKHQRLSRPLPCDCHACTNPTMNIMQVGKKTGIGARALHNYIHLKRIFDG